MRSLLVLAAFSVLVAGLAPTAQASHISRICTNLDLYCDFGCYEHPNTTCICYDNPDLCTADDEIVEYVRDLVDAAPDNAGVQNNGDGTYTVYYIECSNGCYRTDVYTTPRLVPPGPCFTYEPSALTNACFGVGSQSTPVTHPTAGTTTRRICVIGAETCRDVLFPTVGSGTTVVTTPKVSGYFEATVVCGFSVPCRVTLP